MRLGVAARPKIGETLSGDAYFYGEVGDQVLVCLIDGIGHGEEGHRASNKLVQFLEGNSVLDLDELMRVSHQELRGTRGAVVGMAVIREKEDSISYAGVGNITTAVVGTNSVGDDIQTRHLISVGGIVGYNLRKIRRFECPYRGGDALVMFTDGISSRFSVSDYFAGGADPQSIAETILRDQGKDNDDATVLVIKR